MFNPPYRFPSTTEHDGLPNEWKFNWILFQTNFSNKCSIENSQKSCLKRQYCGWCLDSSKCFSGNLTSPFFNMTCDSGWKYPVVEKAYAKPLIITVSVVVILFVSVLVILHICERIGSFT